MMMRQSLSRVQIFKSQRQVDLLPKTTYIPLRELEQLAMQDQTVFYNNVILICNMKETTTVPTLAMLPHLILSLNGNSSKVFIFIFT